MSAFTLTIAFRGPAAFGWQILEFAHNALIPYRESRDDYLTYEEALEAGSRALAEADDQHLNFGGKTASHNAGKPADSREDHNAGWPWAPEKIIPPA